MSFASSPATRNIVAVIGTTGVGKSNLAVSLAHSLIRSSPGSANDELPCLVSTERRQPAVVLSADSMQLYKGLDVITNKVTLAEMEGVEHWGLDMVTPGHGGSWEVGKWCNEADKKIASMAASDLPIICGGTHYFVQHFLFPPPELSFTRSASPSKGKAPLRWTPPRSRPPVPDTMDLELITLLDTFWTSDPQWPTSSSADKVNSSSAGPSHPSSSRPTISEDSQLLLLHQLLCIVDPKEGRRWHWRDGRKVRRGIERWWERGGTVSPEVMEDVAEDNSADKGRKARFRTLIFWVYEPLDTLRPRLDKRVDQMVENGLLKEIAELRIIAEAAYGTADATDHTEGIFQSIGYKEFASLPLPQSQPEAHPSYRPALERTKISTHQYAKSQLKWIQKQLLPAAQEARALGGDVYVYVVNGGERGVAPSVKVLNAFLNGEALPSPEHVGHEAASELLKVLDDHLDIRVPNTADRQDLNARRDCEPCSLPDRPYSLSLKEWDTHVKSRNANPVKRDKAEWIAHLKAQGEAKRLEREKVKEELAVTDRE
ncbi:uncharacterized protein IL334_003458 [Kwoniella shivajii]|uniref:tRNA dimethylallyltransferase n=1 Tax=Kwoniella shivajii TaxID=564305 RepID=A0ABZ1CZD2_9TREE|nr:hypothetical protein IL334_003458 [Kwoniella shivajii]